jgi:hypothetical protein
MIMLSTMWPARWTFLLACAAMLVVGCSGRPRNFAKKVTGKVTLGGQPLAGALVTFTPVDGGSPSFGRTDENGQYNLIWAQVRGRKIEGAQIGEHIVTITTYQEGDPDADPPVPAVPEKVPLKYRQQDGQLKATVQKGTNNIDFNLEPGPVEAPQPKGKARPGARRPAAPGACF